MESEARALVREVGRSSQRVGAVLLRPDLPVGDWSAHSACRFRPLGQAMSCVLSVWAEPWCGNRSPRDPGFMNLTHGIKYMGPLNPTDLRLVTFKRLIFVFLA